VVRSDGRSFVLGEVEVVCGDDAVIIRRVRDATGAKALLPDLDATREFVRTDSLGRYRPLPGARTLPGGWEVRCKPEGVDAVLDEIYPLARTHMRQWGNGELRLVSLDEVLDRQSGRYAVAAKLDEAGRAVARGVLCGVCIKAPVWAGERPGEAIPCPEPCSVMVSLCREAALWQDERPERSAPDASVPFAAFDVPGNEIREAYLEKRYGDG
jgi:sirohydrochlorin cobaltochelatase